MNEILSLLDLEDVSEFEYFENLADLVECEADYSTDGLAQFFAAVDLPKFANLIEDYFDDTIDHMPDEANEACSLLNTVKTSLSGLAMSAVEDENDLALLTEEFYRFRKWFMNESRVECRDLSTGEKQILPVFEAITLARLAKLDQKDYEMDFTDALDYELDEYVVSLGDVEFEGNY